MIAAEAVKSTKFKNFSFPGVVLADFTARKSLRLPVIWSMLFGVSILTSVSGFSALYKTAASKIQLAQTFGNNAGLSALFGKPNHLATAGGFTAWRVLGIAMLICGIWGLLTSTRIFRGEEENGRLEMFLSGQTTIAKSTLNSLLGLLVALIPFILIPAVFVFAAGRLNNLDFSFFSGLFMGLAIAASAAIFISVGALASQFAPIRRRAAMFSAIIFGICFLVRATGDAASSLHWLVNISPLGWVENLHPLTGSNPFWLLPIAALVFTLSAISVYLASRRDLGASLLADKDHAKAKKGLLNSSFGLTLRLEKNAVIGWAIGAGLVGFLYGYIAKTATQIIKDASGAGKIIGKVAGQVQLKGVETFLGIVFLLLMVIVMVQTTNLVAAIRNEESSGFLDNLIVRAVTRVNWLSGRIAVVAFSLATSSIIGTFLAWLAVKSQHVDISFHEMLLAGINILPAGVFIMGLGILVLGYKPRLTSAVMYGMVAWSFLVQMIGSAANLNHYILDTSILHHIQLAPAVNPSWHTDSLIAIIGVVMLILGVLRFNVRDIQGE